MSLFNLDWFKSKAKVIADLEKQLEKEIQELANMKTGSNFPPYPGSDYDVDSTKPYITIKLVNDVLTIVLNDGNIFSKPNATIEDFTNARNARTEDELFNVCTSAEVLADKKAREAEIARAKAILEGIEKLKSYSNEFRVEGTSVYFKGIDRTLPQVMIEEILTIIDKYKYADFTQMDEYQAIKRFFMWCCLNPRAEVANELYRFLKDNSFRITKQGFFVALRNVVTLHGSNQLVQFVSNVYNKVKAVWKTNPSEYHVFLNNGAYELVHEDAIYEDVEQACNDCNENGQTWNEEYEEYNTCYNCDGDGIIFERIKKQGGQDLGVLTDLYLDLPNRHENRFTDDWTKTFDIRIGQPVTMPLDQCNWSTQDCAAAGLHFTSDQIHYVGCGDQSVLVLINPMKVVGIGQHKGRCYEYLPIMTVAREEATNILHDGMFDTLQLDEQFAIDQLQNLGEIAKAGFAIESKKHEFYMPQISISEINNIVLSLEDMKKEISGRVKNI